MLYKDTRTLYVTLPRRRSIAYNHFTQNLSYLPSCKTSQLLTGQLCAPGPIFPLRVYPLLRPRCRDVSTQMEQARSSAQPLFSNARDGGKLNTQSPNMAKFGLAASTHDGGTKALTAREHLLQWQENFDRESLLDNETSDGQNLVKPNHLSKAELSVDSSDGISFRDSTQSLDETDSNVEEDTEQNSGLDLEPHG